MSHYGENLYQAAGEVLWESVEWELSHDGDVTKYTMNHLYDYLRQEVCLSYQDTVSMIDKIAERMYKSTIKKSLYMAMYSALGAREDLQITREQMYGCLYMIMGPMMAHCFGPIDMDLENGSSAAAKILRGLPPSAGQRDMLDVLFAVLEQEEFFRHLY